MTTSNESNAGRLSTADFASAAEPRAADAPHMTDGDQPVVDGQQGTDGQPVERQMVDDTQPIERRTEDRPAQAPLFKGTDGETFHRRWSDIQASFVDEPRGAVEQADSLVAEVMQRLAQVFAEERRTLEQQWDRGGQADTEELRLALRRYRSFFDRLLAM